MNKDRTELIFVVIFLILAGISPNLFVMAQAGIAKLSSLAVTWLIPSFALILILTGVSAAMGFKDLKKQVLNGILAGLAATVGLELIRIIGFQLGWMPGDLPRLLGVLLLDRFAQGPSLVSDVAGWVYHFWNGAAFGIIFSILIGRGKIWMGIAYGIVVGIVFMISPVTRALGIGMFGLEFKAGYQFFTTVTLAHLAFGTMLGWIISKRNKEVPDILKRIKNAL